MKKLLRAAVPTVAIVAVLLGVAGIAIGMPAALALSRLMATLLAGVSGHDPLTYAAVVATLIATTFLASYIPARRATRVDPMVALRTR